nr:MAG TPA: hypothetical protein [Bacteriophage sp.]
MNLMLTMDRLKVKSLVLLKLILISSKNMMMAVF